MNKRAQTRVIESNLKKGGERVAEFLEEHEGGEGMTDKQFVNHLRDLLDIARACKNLEEFIAKLEEKISSYGR